MTCVALGADKHGQRLTLRDEKGDTIWKSPYA